MALFELRRGRNTIQPNLLLGSYEADLRDERTRCSPCGRFEPVIARLMTVPFLTVLLTVCAATVAPQPASAATVSVVENTLTFGAGAREANRLSLDETHVTDTGAVLTAGEGCVSLGPHTASCPDFHVAVLTLADMDDRAVARGTCGQPDPDERRCRLAITGGDGNDTMISRLAADQELLAGGNGDDRLITTTDDDDIGVLRGGAGDDDLAGGYETGLVGGPGADTFRGEGFAMYFGRAKPVVVTLNARRDDGEAGERDLVLVPNVYGGRAHDVLMGDRRGNDLDGGSGRDTVRAAGGRDSVGGGGGNDVLFGGPGRDWIDGDGGSDRAFGGAGADVLFGHEGRDVLTGGRGGDSLDGSAGNDTLRARDGVRDRVRGGAGRDRAQLDRGLDRVRGIERLS